MCDIVLVSESHGSFFGGPCTIEKSLSEQLQNLFGKSEVIAHIRTIVLVGALTNPAEILATAATAHPLIPAVEFTIADARQITGTSFAFVMPERELCKPEPVKMTDSPTNLDMKFR